MPNDMERGNVPGDRGLEARSGKEREGQRHQGLEPDGKKFWKMRREPGRLGRSSSALVTRGLLTLASC
jgi:hypothetical protein